MNDPKSSADFCNRLIAQVTELLRKALAEFATNPWIKMVIDSETVVYLDFARNQLIRSGRPPEKLDNVLFIRTLEQSFRQRTVSRASFLLVSRNKLSGKPSQACNPAAAMRQELKGLRDWIEHGVLPIRIEKNGRDGRIRACFDPARFNSNVLEAAGLAAEAARLRSSDTCGATALAAHALTIDPDAGSAATFLLNIAKQQPDCLTRDDILRAEICLARAIVRLGAAILRLNRPGTQANSDASKARRIAARYLDRLLQRWPVFQSLPFGTSPSDCPGKDLHRDVLNAIVRIASTANTRMNSSMRRSASPDAHLADRVKFEFGAAHIRFANDPVIVGIAERLLARRLAGKDQKLRVGAVQSVTTQLCSALLVSGRLPASMTLEGFKEKFILTFGRDIDWAFLNRSRRRDASFRDDLYTKDDAEGDDQTDNESDD